MAYKQHDNIAILHFFPFAFHHATSHMGRDTHTHICHHIFSYPFSALSHDTVHTPFFIGSSLTVLPFRKTGPVLFLRFFSTLVLVQGANGLRCLLPLRIRGVPRLVTFQTLHRCETRFEKGEMWLGSGGKDIAFIDGPRVLSRRNLPPGQESLRFHTRNYSHCTQYT